MELKKEIKQSQAIKFFVVNNDQVVGRAYLYLIHNDLHDKPYGLLEDVYVEEEYRSHGIGNQLLKAVMAEAKDRGCPKLIGTSRYSRPQVHKWYEKLGFKDWGKEFRMDFNQDNLK